MGQEYTEVIVDVVHFTPGALLCREGGTGPEVWIPRSLIEAGDRIKTGDDQEILVATWFAEKEGLV